ncbi:PREDICTED: target of Myb protein 1 [Tarenaya hassleriana]|uniref:target of Myb protein 1 n=1 Tax=Tarenaya hassleriana TaxID=28532 RepID=UPI00053C7F2A|nr:PREDICTED: target of Myb protein 1 [Tarenaya hassleriana]
MASCSSPSFTLSSVTVAVDKATNELLLTPDWTMIIAICDSVNSHHWQGKDAIKAVKRRLQHKNAKVQLLALTLLEAMVKNCGEHLHSQIAERHLLGEMVKIVRKKGDFEVRNKILILLDTWNEAFGGVACRYPHYNWAYEELRRSGVRFPERSHEAALMLRTSNARPSLAQSSSRHLLSSSSLKRLDETMATEIESLSLSSLESMRNVMDLLKQMVQALNPADSSALKDELIVDLAEQCRSNQKKLIQMLMTTADEDVLARGLELNDSMQGVLARHDSIASGVSLPPSQLQAAISKGNSQMSPKPKDGSAPAPESVTSSSSSESESDEEEMEDDFAQLAKRHTQICEEEALLLLGKNDNITAGNQEATQPTECKDIALSDEAVSTSKMKAEQDIIDLLSLTLTTTAIKPSTCHQSTHQTKSSTEQMLLNSYVVPWAQQSQSQPEEVLPSESLLQQKGQLNTIASQFQQQFSHPRPEQQLQPAVTQFQTEITQRQGAYGYQPPPWAMMDQSNTMWSQRTREGTSLQQQQSLDRQLQYSNSLPARGSGIESSGNVGKAETGLAQKPYVPPYRLFEDLNVFWNAGGGLKSSK